MPSYEQKLENQIPSVLGALQITPNNPSSPNSKENLKDTSLTHSDITTWIFLQETLSCSYS